MKNKNFIIAKDEITRDTLLKSGFDLLDSNDGMYVFLNCADKMCFSNLDVVYTDKLCI